jgi:hypothetical protein
MIIFDDFLETYPALKAHSLDCEFKDRVNEKDGVTYPHICDDIPKDVKLELYDKLSQAKGGYVKNTTLFMRMSPKGVHVPHIAHTDISMGTYSLMLYLHENEDSCTTFLRHTMTGITYQPVLEEFVNLIKNDQNTPEAWTPYKRVFSRENRALIFDAGNVHCAEPVGGFGEGQEDARIVLTCFYD